METRDLELRAVNAAGQGLRVVYSFQTDRWQHRIDQVNNERAIPAWQSVEGSAHDDWPCSPALQDLSLETLPDGRQVIFLVGKAGTSHWSASIEAVAEPPQLIFDLACRHGATPGQLGSRYELLASDAAIQFTQSDLASTQVASVDNAFQIAPQLTPDPKPQQTTRWKYVARLGHRPG